MSGYIPGPGPDYRPRSEDPNDLVTPEERAEMYRTGLERVRAILRAKGHPEHGKHYQEREEA